MLIVKVQGGLGNQLFQYAFGRAMAIKNNTQLLLDASHYKYTSDHTGYVLDRYNIQAVTANYQFAFFKAKCVNLIKRLPKALQGMFGYLYEDGYRFSESCTEFSEGYTYVGYWQSWKYFYDVLPTIKSDLVLKDNIPAHAAQLIQHVKSCNSISIHIRRGDYITNPKAASIYRSLPMSYYNDAIGVIKESVDNPFYFVFSDDPEWVAENLDFGTNSLMVSSFGFSPQVDMMIMSHCKHNIIANSTFSYWGAMLNDNAGAIKISPNKWFNPGSLSEEDVIPDNWLRI